MIRWKINKLSAEGDVVTHAHYSVSITDGINTVETEGNWFFSDTTVKKPFAEVNEQDIVDLIKKETTNNNVCAIEFRLSEQLEALKNNSNQHLPWLPPIFKLGV